MGGTESDDGSSPGSQSHQQDELKSFKRYWCWLLTQVALIALGWAQPKQECSVRSPDDFNLQQSEVHSALHTVHPDGSLWKSHLRVKMTLS